MKKIKYKDWKILNEELIYIVINNILNELEYTKKNINLNIIMKY